MKAKELTGLNDKTVIKFLESHSVAALATVNSESKPLISTIYYVLNESEILFITKSDTAKYINLRNNPNIALVITNEKEMTTLQVEGKAAEVEATWRIDQTIKKITSKSAHPNSWPPPIIKLKKGELVVVSIKPTFIRLTDFR